MCGGDIPQDKAGPDPEDLVHPSGPLGLSSLLFLCHPGSDEDNSYTNSYTYHMQLMKTAHSYTGNSLSSLSQSLLLLC